MSGSHGRDDHHDLSPDEGRLSGSRGRHLHHGMHAAGVSCAILTLSDTRTADTDASGRLIEEILAREGHRVVKRSILPDDEKGLVAAVRELAARAEIAAILINGGTGIAPRDRTASALDEVLTRRILGFGELFRSLSYAEIGPAAMLSGAVAGLVGRVVVFAMPGSPAAVRLAMERLIVPELGHIVGEAGKGLPGPAASGSGV
jgi:molybdenum cofactor biosynthesis protein B